MKPAKGSALDIPAEPMAGCQYLFGALRAPRTAMRIQQRVQNPRLGPHSGPIALVSTVILIFAAAAHAEQRQVSVTARDGVAPPGRYFSAGDGKAQLLTP